MSYFDWKNTFLKKTVQYCCITVLNSMVHKWGNLFFWTYGPLGRERLSLLLRMVCAFLCCIRNITSVMFWLHVMRRDPVDKDKGLWSVWVPYSGAKQKPKKVFKHPVSLFASTDGTVVLFLCFRFITILLFYYNYFILICICKNFY